MERLTERDEYGNADIKGIDSSELQGSLSYKDFMKVTETLNRLAEYEDLEEENRIIRLPVADGTTIYWILDSPILEGGEWLENWVIEEQPFIMELLGEWGNKIFATREEAEARLKEMEDNNEDK